MRLLVAKLESGPLLYTTSGVGESAVKYGVLCNVSKFMGSRPALD